MLLKIASFGVFYATPKDKYSKYKIINFIGMINK